MNSFALSTRLWLLVHGHNASTSLIRQPGEIPVATAGVKHVARSGRQKRQNDARLRVQVETGIDEVPDAVADGSKHV
jgi:hypothetical protein